MTKDEIAGWTAIAERVIAGKFPLSTESEVASLVYGLRTVPGPKIRLALVRLSTCGVEGADRVVKRLVVHQK